jgi:hypothetical protein
LGSGVSSGADSDITACDLLPFTDIGLDNCREDGSKVEVDGAAGSDVAFGLAELVFPRITSRISSKVSFPSFL